MIRPTRLMACFLALGCLAAGAAQAQAPGVGRSAPSRGVSLPAPLPDPNNTSSGNVGIRLDPGAVLCRTTEALGQRQAAMTASTAGDDAQTLLPAGCFRVTTRTPVEVLERRGYGRTQVKTMGRNSETGWTDAYLPAR